jgi:hypothetical protein
MPLTAAATYCSLIKLFYNSNREWSCLLTGGLLNAMFRAKGTSRRAICNSDPFVTSTGENLCLLESSLAPKTRIAASVCMYNTMVTWSWNPINWLHCSLIVLSDRIMNGTSGFFNRRAAHIQVHSAENLRLTDQWWKKYQQLHFKHFCTKVKPTFQGFVSQIAPIWLQM